MELQGRRITILDEDYFEKPELWYPHYRMHEVSTEVLIVGNAGASQYESKAGYPASVDVAADQVSPADLVAVIMRHSLVTAGAEWEGQEVVIDGSLISSRMPKGLPAFCHAIVGALE